MNYAQAERVCVKASPQNYSTILRCLLRLSRFNAFSALSKQYIPRTKIVFQSEPQLTLRTYF
jgi:hypothetical protein